MSKKINLILLLIIGLGIGFFNPIKVSAKTDYYDKYTVNYYIEKDSRVRVEEVMDISYNGEYHGTHRSIDLFDVNAQKKCQNNQCGGISFLSIDDVWDIENGSLKKDSDYKVIKNNLANGSSNVDIRYTFAPNGRLFNNEIFTWGIKYTAFGSILNFRDYDLFYWDTVFADRTVNINHVVIKIHFPKDFDFNGTTQLKLFNKSVYNWNNGVLTIIPSVKLSPGDPNTILVKFPKGLVDASASIEVRPYFGGIYLGFLNDSFKFKFENKEVYSDSNVLKGLPTGKQNIELISPFFSTVKLTENLKSGDNIIKNIDMTPSSLSIILIIVFLICNSLGIFLIFFGLFFPFYRWYRNGRDKGGKKTIVPWFQPPDDISPSMLGSLKDETVNTVDITAAIIHAAYKKFVHIRELKGGKDFEFTKLKDYKNLASEEVKILDSIFGGNLKITTNELENSFYTKLSGIHDHIYNLLMVKGYFNSRPDYIRLRNFVSGFILVFVSIVIAVIAFSVKSFIAIAFIFLPVIGITILGIGILAFAKFMPAKTPRGTLTLERIKGFRMYLNTAERFRMQNLTPDMFEKYLAYAIVFGIENAWADKFKNIYKKSPDWYEGSRSDVTWTPYLLSRSLSRMNHITARSVTSRPATSGSGGGFSGGFSGGGAGGGGGGSW